MILHFIVRCDSICKYNKKDANHNGFLFLYKGHWAVILYANIIKRTQITTDSIKLGFTYVAVILYANIIKRTQITTLWFLWLSVLSCDSICKYNKKDANHNAYSCRVHLLSAVILYANIIKRTQITTGCFVWSVWRVLWFYMQI